MKKILLGILIGLTFFACNEKETSQEGLSENALALNKWFQGKYDRNLNDNPEALSNKGKKDRQFELNDISEEKALQRLEWAKTDLKELMAFETEGLDEQTLLSYQLFKEKLERNIANAKYMHYAYPENQMYGLHSGFPSFMINMHPIDNKEDALAYISRLNAFEKKCNQLLDNMKIREAEGIIVPAFAFDYVIQDCINIINKDKAVEENIFVKDLAKKLNKLEPKLVAQDSILNVAKQSVADKVRPAYKKLIVYLKKLKPKAPNDDSVGVWRLQDGDAFYQAKLEEITTTKLTGDEIFDIGIKEVARIQDEMRAIMTQVGFEGNLNEFFVFMRESKQFYFQDSDAGRDSLNKGYVKIIDDMYAKVDEYFNIQPKSKLIVKPVEAYREKSAGKAFYSSGTVDGSRPGMYYFNAYKMEDMPKYEMEALAFHEGVPGHHFQVSIAQELGDDIPEFRKHGAYTAYVEGWGLYSEYLGKEMGFYKDPYSDFGRLAMEIWRACRLVVDAGLHHKKWSRTKAIQYLADNTPSSRSACVKAIERYVVLPGQATAYKIGMLKILELRKKAKDQLGDKFDIKAFHDVVLKSGALPLSVLEDRVNLWIEANK